MIGEVARGKALAIVLSKATVVDSNGDDVDMTEFTAPVTGSADDSEFVEASAGTETDHDGHGHGSANDGHGRSRDHEHYGHDHK